MGIVLLLKPIVNIAAVYGFAVRCAPSTYVVNREKLNMHLSAAHTDAASISVKGGKLETCFILSLCTTPVAAVVRGLLLKVSGAMAIIIHTRLCLMRAVVRFAVTSNILLISRAPISVVLALAFSALLIHKGSIARWGYFHEFFKEIR